MTLRELIEILDERVELFVYAKDGLHTMHLYDKDYLYHWHEEFLKKKGNSHQSSRILQIYFKSISRRFLR